MSDNIQRFVNCIVLYGKIQNFIISHKNLNIDNLRKFHNLIKSNLIINYSKGADNFLDIACGRGGDLQKWLNPKLNLKYILAFDYHKDSIYSSIRKGGSYDGAIARFLNIKNTYNRKLPFINFKNLSLLDPNVLDKINKIDSNKKYDVVSCQFAMHYFCENSSILDKVLNVISKKLSKGGYFIGTATDGDIIHNILSYGNVNIPLLSLIKMKQNNYLFYIQTSNQKDLTRQNYFEVQGVSSEFYLFKEQFKTLALKNNLELVSFKSFNEWYKEMKGNKSFNELSVYELVVSFMNFSFVFKKI